MTISVTAVVLVALPDVAFTVMVYVPAGVPTVVLVLFEFEHPDCSVTPPKTTTNAIAISQRRRRERPLPTNASPEIGSQNA